MQQIDDLVYYDSNRDGDNEDNGDTFHDSIQVEDMIDDTYNDDDDVNRKPTIIVIDCGEQHLKEWSLKKYRIDNIKEDQAYWIPDPLDHLDSISSFPDLYSNKQNPAPLKRAHSSQGMLSCSNTDLLKYTHSPQGMLSLIDPTGCCVMERKDGECPDPEVKLYHRGAHRRRYLGKPVGEMDYVWGDNESMSNNSTVLEAKLHKRHNILLFRYVRSMISRGYINLQHLASNGILLIF